VRHLYSKRTNNGNGGKGRKLMGWLLRGPEKGYFLKKTM
jgi:hypothetical protein